MSAFGKLPLLMQPPVVRATQGGIENWHAFERWAANNNVLFNSVRHSCTEVGMPTNEYLKLLVFLLIEENESLKQRIISDLENNGRPNFFP